MSNLEHNPHLDFTLCECSFKPLAWAKAAAALDFKLFGGSLFYVMFYIRGATKKSYFLGIFPK